MVNMDCYQTNDHIIKKRRVMDNEMPGTSAESIIERLSRLEEEVIDIRTKLEKKPARKNTLHDLETKLNIILNILSKQ